MSWATLKAKELVKGYCVPHRERPLVEAIAKALREAHSAGMDEMMKMVKEKLSEKENGAK